MGLFQKKKPKSNRLDAKDYEKLGRDFEDILIKDYIEVLHSTPRQIWSSFVRGLFTGLGGVVGATVGVAILAAILLYVGPHIPVVGQYLKAAGDTIKSGR
jgi:hypothetical protein